MRNPHLFKVGVNLKHGWAPAVTSLSLGVIRVCVNLGLDAIHLNQISESETFHIITPSHRGELEGGRNCISG